MSATEILAPVVPGATMYALLTDQETAMPEAALCGSCYADPNNQGYAEEQGMAADDWDREGWRSVSGNEALACVVCGVDNEGNPGPAVD